MDWAEACNLLGISETATETEMREQYYYKAQLLHPDKNQDKPEHVRKKAEAELALVNRAFDFVSNPINNPYRIPPKLAVEPMGIRFKSGSYGEKKTTTLTIRNTGGPYTSIWIDNNPAPWLAVVNVKSLTAERLPLEITLECTGTGEPDRRYSCDLLVKLENEKTHAVDQALVRVELFNVIETTENTGGNEQAGTAQKTGFEAPRQPVENIPEYHERRGMGFSVTAFVVNFIGFAAVSAFLIVMLNSFTELDRMSLMIIGIICILIAFGFSFNHAITVGSRAGQAGGKKANPGKRRY
ncbi:MAG: DnaJ domain-containing protein [Dehalococcoidales bacterium]|nr:DnaJ domain-containing protein [Dehalococcoidales bacterium]